MLNLVTLMVLSLSSVTVASRPGAQRAGKVALRRQTATYQAIQPGAISPVACPTNGLRYSYYDSTGGNRIVCAYGDFSAGLYCFYGLFNGSYLPASTNTNCPYKTTTLAKQTYVGNCYTSCPAQTSYGKLTEVVLQGGGDFPGALENVLCNYETGQCSYDPTNGNNFDGDAKCLTAGHGTCQSTVKDFSSSPAANAASPSTNSTSSTVSASSMVSTASNPSVVSAVSSGVLSSSTGAITSSISGGGGSSSSSNNAGSPSVSTTPSGSGIVLASTSTSTAVVTASGVTQGSTGLPFYTSTWSVYQSTSISWVSGSAAPTSASPVNSSACSLQVSTLFAVLLAALVATKI